MKLDERGWRIPKVGSKSHLIYKWFTKGKPTAWIATKVGMPPDTVHILIHRFKHPKKHNEWAVKSYHKRKPTKG